MLKPVVCKGRSKQTPEDSNFQLKYFRLRRCDPSVRNKRQNHDGQSKA